MSEIERLERRFAENRQGLTFAPLANAYRKQGRTAEALALLEEGLQLHPDYLPASIVLGHCHLDLGEPVAAEAAFRRVLDLDPENVIALKALADLTASQERWAEADAYLRGLLAVDRANEEARALLDRVAAELSGVTAAGAEGEALAVTAPDEPPVEPETDVAADAPADVAVAKAPREAPVAEEPVAGPEWTAAPEASTSSGEPLVLERAPESTVILPVAGLIGRQASPDVAPVEGFERLEVALDATPSTPDLVDADGPVLEARAEHMVEVPDSESIVSRASGIDVEREEEIVLRAGDVSEFQSFSAAETLESPPERAAGLVDGMINFDAPVGDLATTLDPDATQELEIPVTTGLESTDLALGAASADPVEPASDEPPATGLSPASLAALTEQYPSLALTESWPAAEAAAAPTADEWPASASAEGEPPVAAEPPAVEPVAVSEAPEAPWAVEPAGTDEPAAAAPEPEPTGAPADALPVAVAPEPAEALAPPAPAWDGPIVLAGDEEDDEDPPFEDDAEPVVTESMAELYLRQGHTAAALEVYRALAASQPEEPRFGERVAELSAALAPGAPARTIGELFAALLAARPGAVEVPPVAASAASAAEPAAPAPDAGATRPADDPLTLGAVFGGAEGAGTSYDDFFRAPAPAEGGAATSGADGDDDLDQFNAWLQSLKR